MLSDMVKEFTQVLMKQPKLQEKIGQTSVIIASLFLAKMYLFDDADAIYKSIGSVTIGIAFLLSSYITSNEIWAEKLRYRIVGVGAVIFFFAMLRGDGTFWYDLFVRKN